MNYELIIQSGNKAISPSVADGMTLESTRNGAGKLSFNAVRDNENLPAEGDLVTLKVNGIDVFYGYIFTRKWDKEGLVGITAYDQLRYFKNHDTYVYSGKTASQVLTMIADDFGMKKGEIANTGYVIPSRVEDNETLFDIVGNALDLTLKNTGEMFVMYDDFGKIALKSTEDMKVREDGGFVLIDGGSAENFEFSSSIENAYNRIKLVREDKKSGRREVYISANEDDIKKWGILQFFGKLSKEENGKAKADCLLKLYSEKTRTIKLKNVMGNLNVRGGSVIAVSLDALGLGEEKEFMLVESVKHTFKENEHYMDISLYGGKND